MLLVPRRNYAATISSPQKSAWPVRAAENCVIACAKHLLRWGSVRSRLLLMPTSPCLERPTARPAWSLFQELGPSAVASTRVASVSAREVGDRSQATRAPGHGSHDALFVRSLTPRMAVVQKPN